jgi:hypothetical protein
MQSRSCLTNLVPWGVIAPGSANNQSNQIIMTKEQLIKRVEQLFIEKEEFMQDLQKLMENGAITDKDIEEMEDSFLPIYPIAAAIYERRTGWYLTGSCDDRIRRKTRRMCNFYKGSL